MRKRLIDQPRCHNREFICHKLQSIWLLAHQTTYMLVKRFSITSVQRLKDGTWFFKQMKLEVRNPQNPNRTIALDYLEMDDLPGKK